MIITLMSMGDIIALAVVAVCAVWVAWKLWRRLRGSGDCGCEHCPANKRADV
jgi:hypothetical protein